MARVQRGARGCAEICGHVRQDERRGGLARIIQLDEIPASCGEGECVASNGLRPPWSRGGSVDRARVWACAHWPSSSGQKATYTWSGGGGDRHALVESDKPVSVIH